MGASSLPLVILFSLSISGVVTVCGNAELRALMDIKSSLDPENKHLSSWTSDGDPCSGTFEGVACNDHRKVANISLQGKGLTGRVPPALAVLKCLSGLYLHYNSLTGEIPKEISSLTELSDLYLNVNNLSGSIPTELGQIANLQVLQLCCNQLNGSIPIEIGLLKKLNVLAVQHNRLSGQIPTTLGNLGMLKWLNVSFNHLSGPIPRQLAKVPELEVLDVQNNSLYGAAPPALRRLNGGFHYGNNPGLCGVGFPLLRVCTAWDNINVNQVEPFEPVAKNITPKTLPQAANVDLRCNQSHCSGSSKILLVGVVSGVTVVALLLVFAGLFSVFQRRRRKQRIGNTSDTSDDRLSAEQAKDFYRQTASPLVSLEYSNRWDPMFDDPNGKNGGYPELFQGFKFNLEEVESATQHFSEVNLLGKSKFSAVYKGILKDGSVVAVKSINVINCKPQEDEFIRGLNILTSLRHDNLVRLRGFCCSKGRGECFLVYDYASKGNLTRYLDLVDGSSHTLDWHTRVSVINGIAKGITYLHGDEINRTGLVHQNISVEKVLIDQQFNPLISDSGLLRLLADDIVFSALKVSAALGYMAPEYVTTGRFTEKSDVYAFGVIILQILSGIRKLSNSMRLAAESLRYSDFIDRNLNGQFTQNEAAKLTKVALACTQEHPDRRPSMKEVTEELNKPSDTFLDKSGMYILSKSKN